MCAARPATGGEAPAADAALEPSLGDERASAFPLPEVSAARSGGTGLMAAAPEGAAEGGFCAEDAREATGPRAPRRMGGAGAARGGGAVRDASSGGYPMVGPKELLDKVAPTPTQAGGDESQVVTLALRLIAGIEGVAFCALPVVAARINAEGRGSARKHYDGRKTAPVVRREGVITGTVGKAREGLMLR